MADEILDAKQALRAVDEARIALRQNKFWAWFSGVTLVGSLVPGVLTVYVLSFVLASAPEQARAPWQGAGFFGILAPIAAIFWLAACINSCRWDAKHLRKAEYAYEVLVICSSHSEDAADRPDIAADLMNVAANWVRKREIQANIITSIGPDATQTVFHTHLHVVPRRQNDGLHLPWTDQVKS